MIMYVFGCNDVNTVLWKSQRIKVNAVSSHPLKIDLRTLPMNPLSGQYEPVHSVNFALFVDSSDPNEEKELLSMVRFTFEKVTEKVTEKVQRRSTSPIPIPIPNASRAQDDSGFYNMYNDQ